MYIAPGIHKNEWINLNLNYKNDVGWDCAVEIFYERIKSRYLEPIDLLIVEDKKRALIDRRYGFSIIAIDCLLIETLQSFIEGLTDSKNKSKELFINFLTTSDSFKEYFTKDQAIRFFYDFRCGILHQAEVMGSSLLWSVGLLICKKSNGTSYLNRTKFHEYLKNDIILYTENLKNPLNKELRKNFIIKMNYISRKID